MKSLFRVFAILALLILLSGGACINLSQTHDNAFTGDGLLTADATQLTSTRVEGYLEVPIRSGTNILWCGTFQLAWNEICSLIGEDIHFDSDPGIVAVMNKKSFTGRDLDEECYVALAGFVRDGIYRDIDKALKTKFKGQATPRYKPTTLPRPQDIAAYAYLFKNMEFAEPFERMDDKLTFKGQPVAAFGMGEDFKPGHVLLCPQISILDYKDPDDFVIELITKTKGERIVLAKIRPQKTMDSTILAVQSRTKTAKPSEAIPGDVLKVPKLNFDITRKYEEIEGLRLVAKNPKVAKDLLLLSAVQNTRFQMDEKGVRLKSEAHLAFGCAANITPLPQHVMIFDKPFLIMLQRADAKTPYFALWVDNADILVRE
jgi:hypothetical protein